MTDADDAFNFIDLGIIYCACSTDASPAFAEGTLLCVLGHALGREVYNEIQPDAVYHNVYMLLNGKSTLTRKTSVQKLIKKTYDQNRWLANESSPEALLEELTEQSEGIIWAGEFSKILKGIKSGGYMAASAEVLNDMFDCPELYIKKLVNKKDSKHKFVIKNAYLSYHTTCTPAVLKETLTREMADGGSLPRFLIVNGEPHRTPRKRLRKDVLNMVQIIRNMLNFMLKIDKSNTVFVLSDEALQYYNEEVEKVTQSEKYERVSSIAGRYENYVIAIADLYMISEALGKAFGDGTPSTISTLVQLVALVQQPEKATDDNTSPYTSITTNFSNSSNRTNCTNYLIVQKKYVERAWKFVKPCLDNAKELIEYIDMGKELSKITEYFREHGRNGNKAWHSEMLTYTNVGAKIARDCIQTLMERSQIEQFTEPVTSEKRKRPYEKIFYKWIGD